MPSLDFDEKSLGFVVTSSDSVEKPLGSVVPPLDLVEKSLGFAAPSLNSAVMPCLAAPDFVAMSRSLVASLDSAVMYLDYVMQPWNFAGMSLGFVASS